MGVPKHEITAPINGKKGFLHGCPRTFAQLMPFIRKILFLFMPRHEHVKSFIIFPINNKEKYDQAKLSPHRETRQGDFTQFYSAPLGDLPHATDKKTPFRKLAKRGGD